MFRGKCDTVADVKQTRYSRRGRRGSSSRESEESYCQVNKRVVCHGSGDFVMMGESEGHLSCAVLCAVGQRSAVAVDFA